MDNLNKTISFVLGLIVVLVFFAVVSGRLNLKGKLPFIASVSPTPIVSVTPTPSASPTGTRPQNSSYNSYKKPSAIPSTGSPTLLLPILLSGISGGLILRRSKSRNS